MSILQKSKHLDQKILKNVFLGGSKPTKPGIAIICNDNNKIG